MKLEEKRKKRRRAAGDESAVLPPELLDLIILRLPLVSIIRARCVCRSWNAEIRSASFAERKAKLDHELGREPKGWLITMIGRYKKKWVWLFDPHTGHRHKIFFPSHLEGIFYYAVAVGGLLFVERGCFYENGVCCTKVCAWNPITGFTKELEVPVSQNFAVVATSLTHKLYPLQPSSLLDRSIFSNNNGWNRINFLPHCVQLSFGTYCNGYLFRTKCFRDRTVNAVNMVTSETVGIELPTELDRASRWGIKLVECGGSLLLMAACTPSRRRADHMQIWRLQGSAASWEWGFVCAMPEALYGLVFKGMVTQHNWKCSSVDEIVLISSSHRRVEEHEGVVIFDSKSLSWSQVEHVHHERQYCPWSSPSPFYPSFAPLDC